MMFKSLRHHLGQGTLEANDLEEISPEEYASFGSIMHGEKIYRGADIHFLDSQWAIRVGAIDGKIYKIAVQYLEEKQPTDELLFKAVLQYLTNEIGAPGKHELFSKKYFWNGPKRTLMLNCRSVTGSYCINIILTSKAMLA